MVTKLHGRISLTLNEKTYKKLRKLQEKKKKHWSFSKIVSKVLEKGVKKYGY